MSDRLTEQVAKHLQDNIPNANTVDYFKQARGVIRMVRRHDSNVFADMTQKQRDGVSP